MGPSTARRDRSTCLVSRFAGSLVGVQEDSAEKVIKTGYRNMKDGLVPCGVLPYSIPTTISVESSLNAFLQ